MQRTVQRPSAYLRGEKVRGLQEVNALLLLDEAATGHLLAFDSAGARSIVPL
jgi:hypothetical protein